MDGESPEPFERGIFESETVRFIVGRDQVVFSIHSQILRDDSEYYKHLPDPLPDQELPNEDPETFHVLLNWLYRKTLSPLYVEPGDTLPFQLYTLAERLEMSVLLSEIEQYLLSSPWISPETWCHPAAIRHVYENSAPGSKARKFILEWGWPDCHCHSYSGTPDCFSFLSQTFDIPLDYIKDISKATRRM
ncbi:uncharacterized protein BO66DRAFT_436152 [Aspergillus aculeatinus CBS 121060]|uniref:Uncharacterized protein n=1 Tax=Aspergillus aculeatinus CBS 121060 TaxID=1448322 RepID=A0ACD1HG59_9EURO|nr:hypothetical protein BO66DRAFT_436152 [Aspergillus aculeatinus CBS 121060]RAH72485.1 hypothetical protein BO66DRAFT_436152 [Aspergillus aculeatinus CBS 121060]